MNKFNILVFSIILGISIYFLFQLVENQVYLHEWKIANETFSNRYYQLEHYQSLSSKLQNNELFFFDYAQRLAFFKKWKEADSIISHKVLTRQTTSKLLILRGDIQLCLHDTTNAIENYKLACFIVPHSLISKFRLMKTNLAIGDTTKGYFWANCILNEHVKIRSPTSDSIQAEVLHFFTKK